MRRNHLLSPLKAGAITKYKFIGFDIETFSDSNIFQLGGLAWKTEEQTYYKKFWDRENMLTYLDNLSKCQKTYFVATNLNFDLIALFYDSCLWNRLKILFRNGDIIFASFTNKKGVKIKFIDTMNYAPFSVEKLGDILKFQKLEKPSTWKAVFKDGEFYKYDVHRAETKQEKAELEKYNRIDCLISSGFMKLMQKGINKAGGKFKITIASSSMDIWRRKYLNITLLKESHILNDEEISGFIFKGYYGGRTEVYKRGVMKNLFYYDINSLYPAVMRNKYPLPNSVKKILNPKTEYIQNYEGVSEVYLFCPEMDKPFLPVRDKKLIFPCGYIRGVYNHNELRKAFSLGYELKHISKQIIYTETFEPFKDFVCDFYALRMEQKKAGNPLENATKLILNSLYGKFGMKKVNKTIIKDIREYSHSQIKDILTDDFDLIGHHILLSTEQAYLGSYAFPVLSSYTTSYARILMYDYINSKEVVYTDTDSIFISENKYDDSGALGEMKLETFVTEGEFFKPKFYSIKIDNDIIIKIKGLSRASEYSFHLIKKGEAVPKFKISKIKESLRQGIDPLSSMIVSKKINLEDDKREWFMNDSKALRVEQW